ncbi:hypothetical protein PV10_08373 [Exophiala mesophila]|uniref:Transcription factor domain-containing protein n=1 Tax=Exophiala mesophila TaxID=212818 RepID=A0A0D1WIN5_EXOME|nr:uncharacterized protein PV10_08373 [Exophiala mesophila]KIV88715.1 hypothetical protein PV10_08373 [Exophiala mesophila]
MMAEFMFVQDPSTQRTTRDKELLLSRIRSHAAHTTRVKKTSKTLPLVIRKRAAPQNGHLYDDDLINPRSVAAYRSKTQQLEEQFLIREKSRLERVINDVPSPTSYLGQSKRDPFETNPTRRLPLFMHDVWEYAFDVLLPKNEPGLRGAALVASMLARRRAASQNLLDYHCQVSNIATLALPLFKDPSSVRQLGIVQMEHQNFAIQLINKQIQATGKRAASDALINAIFMLGIQEVGPGSWEVDRYEQATPLSLAFNFHAYVRAPGLNRQYYAWISFVKQRGGLEMLQDKALARRLQLCSIVVSSCTGEPPPFPLLRDSVSRAESLMPGIGHTITEPSYSLDGEEIGLPSNSSTYTALLGSVQQLTEALHAFVEQKKDAIQLSQLSLLAGVLQHRLCSVRPPSKDKPGHAAENAIRLALLVYSDTLFFPIPSVRSARERLAAEIKESLSELITTNPRRFLSSGILAWAFVLGGIASESNQHRDWFVDYLRANYQLDSCRWDTYKAGIRLLPWSETFLDPSATRLWNEAFGMGEPNSEQCVITEDVRIWPTKFSPVESSASPYSSRASH